MAAKGMAPQPGLAKLTGFTSTPYSKRWVDDAERTGDVS